ncbi:HsdM family class I SAM-dependent methyltransferase [Pseudarthrobacter phenanthrenivorans]|uniref:HsdM family class I SAM-dependent methyltransferase n=1 Tax=Pseudarthrobacter phenanthrenivorans TaxID=361575 RepID=UPI00217E7628|nr:SAM-dependent methyltransferase [Pseudarthrobacter phenanthrenivorans]
MALEALTAVPFFDRPLWKTVWVLDVLREDDTNDLRKARGAFFTPSPVTDYIASWAMTHGTTRVLEPSCGEAAFLLSADKFAKARKLPQVSYSGVELFETSARFAEMILADAGIEADVHVSDFFSVVPNPVHDCVIGNPPYIRYQEHTGESRERSRAAAAAAGVGLSELASSWAAFVVHSAQFLRRGGRLGLVLPAELLSVNYAAPVRRFLLESFKKVELVLFSERVFPTVQEEVVLLLAEGFQEGPTDRFALFQAESVQGLSSMNAPSTWIPGAAGEKWTASMVGPRARSIYDASLSGSGFSVLHDWGETSLGAVTGNNSFFALTWDQVKERGLNRNDLVRISPPGSRHLRGLELSARRLRQLSEEGKATYLFRPAGAPSPAGEDLIREGESDRVNDAYKCRVRSPWWRVPLVSIPDLFLTYMNADTPRLTTNNAGVHHLNSVHGVYFRLEHRELGRELLPIASINTLTMLGAETVGRAYGGGMLKIEPKEADLLPVPSPTLVAAQAEALHAIRSRVASALRNGDLPQAVELVDEVILKSGLGLADSDIKELKSAQSALYSRRKARSKPVLRG